jgi:hypothetical protein
MKLLEALDAYKGEVETGIRAAVYNYGQSGAISIMDVYHSETRAPYARLSGPADMEASNLSLLALVATQKGYGLAIESDEWWPMDHRKLYLDRDGQPLTKANRYIWRLNTLLAQHNELIGFLSTGPVYCLRHALEMLGGAALNHLTLYHKKRSGGFLSREQALNVLLPNSYYCCRCPPDTLLPGLDAPNIPCSLCGFITHRPVMREAYTQEYGRTMLWFCEECSAGHKA